MNTDLYSKYSEMSNEQLKSSLLLIYPSKKINAIILLELEKRNFRNDPMVLRYLLDLKSMKIESWSVDRLLLSLFDINSLSNKIVNPIFINEKSNVKREFRLKKVIKSIKHKKMSKHFLNFVSTLEHIIKTLNTADKPTKEYTILKYSSFIFQFLDLQDRIKSSNTKSFRLIDGTFHYKETWLLALKNRSFIDQILFLILFNTKDITDHRIQVLNNSLKKLLIDYVDLYKIVDNLDKRYKSELTEGICVATVENKKEMEEFSFSSFKAEKTEDQKCLEWYNARNKSQ